MPAPLPALSDTPHAERLTRTSVSQNRCAGAPAGALRLVPLAALVFWSCLHGVGATTAAAEMPGTVTRWVAHSPTDKAAVLAVALRPDKMPEPCADTLFELDFERVTIRRILDGTENDQPEDDRSCLLDPKYTAKGDQIVFTVPAWADSSAVHVLDLATGKVRFLIDGGPVIVMAGPGLDDRILVLRHKYAEEADSFAYDEADVVRLSDGIVLDNLKQADRQRMHGADWAEAELARLRKEGVTAW